MTKRTEALLELGLTHIITISDDGTAAHSYRVSPVYGSDEQEDIEVPATGDEVDEIAAGRTSRRADIVRRLIKRWRGGGSFAIMDDRAGGRHRRR